MKPVGFALSFVGLVLWGGAALALDSVQVRFKGYGDAELLRSINAASTLKTLVGNADTTGGDVVAAARSDYANIVEVMYANAYYSSVVSILIDGREAALIDPFREPANISSVQIIVQPGKAFRFGGTRIGPLVDRTPLDNGFQTGAPALADVVRDATKDAVDDWRGVGFAKAKVANQSVLARHAAAQLDVDVDISTGPRVKFGNTRVTGETTVREKRIRKIAGLPTGQVYDPKAVADAASRLRKTGTFKSVQVTEAEEVAPDGSMDMQISVVDRKPRRIGGGVEFSSLDGLTLSGYWLHRNLLGGAEEFRVDGEVAQIAGDASGVDYSLSFRFEKPAAYGPDTLLFAKGGLFYLDEPDFEEKKLEFVVGLSREIGDNLTAELGLGYGYSRITDLYTGTPTKREVQLVSVPFALTYDTRDDRLDAKDGVYLKGEVTPFYETIRSQTGAHLSFDARAYRALGGEDRTVLAGRLQLGSLLGLDVQDAPPAFLFYSGGGGTVRGQPYQSLGVPVVGGSFGGGAFAALSGEVRHSLNDTFGLVAFVDAGYIGASGFGDGDWHAGAGVGLRYKTPVGPIRLDVAAPVAGDTGSGVQLYVGIGQAF
ncbi:autotransporter assembly complex protein TamA [Litoreibacter arenae]|nr:autotransporter assembly complex family protein [Litoreibacter arenae]